MLDIKEVKIKNKSLKEDYDLQADTVIRQFEDKI